MTNWSLINQTVELIAQREEYEGITEQNSTITNRVLDWYNHTDITDVNVLAAAASMGSYDPTIKYSDLVEAAQDWAPAW